MINLNQFIAAQSKAVIAQSLGDRKMLSEALIQCRESLSASGTFLPGTPSFAYKMILDNVLVNFESFGDLTIFDGDTRMVFSQINLEIEPTNLAHLPKWRVN